MNLSTSSAPLLQVTGVTVRFGGLTAVDDVSFDVQQGDLLGLIGPNGAGKTTTLRTIMGLWGASQGTLTFAGAPLPRTTPEVAMELIEEGINVLPLPALPALKETLQ